MVDLGNQERQLTQSYVVQITFKQMFRNNYVNIITTEQTILTCICHAGMAPDIFRRRGYVPRQEGSANFFVVKLVNMAKLINTYSRILYAKIYKLANIIQS